MSVIIRHKLLNIPVMLVNFVNTRAYDSSPLHQFSMCCKSPIRYKKVCEKCGKEKLNSEILKGTDAEHILSPQQQDRLKEQLENQTIEILSFETETEQNNILSKMLLIQKSALILPSMSKGYKMRDVNIFLSFKEALKELNVFCKVKYISRAKEHIGILKILGDDLVFIELPFYSRLNHQEIKRLKEQATALAGEPNLKDFAQDYIKANIKPVEFETIKEKKAILIKQYLENAINGEDMPTAEPKQLNPFVVEK